MSVLLLCGGSGLALLCSLVDLPCGCEEAHRQTFPPAGRKGILKFDFGSTIFARRADFFFFL